MTALLALALAVGGDLELVRTRTATVGVLHVLRGQRQWQLERRDGSVRWLALRGKDLPALELKLREWDGQRVRVLHRPGYFGLGQRKYLLVEAVTRWPK